MKLLLSLLLLATICSAQQSDPFTRENNLKRAQNPEGLLFTVRVKDNRKQFHQGEVITLELSFASSKPDTLILDAATYDRSGRLHSDGFMLNQRDGITDPLYEYFFSGFFDSFGGGLRGIGPITDKPYVITAELNEWKRFDRPGRYRLYVVSSRVGPNGSRGTFLDNAGSPVVSNVVEFEILPHDKKWARQKLNEAITALAKPGKDRQSACRTLRFLGTTAAASEMVKRFRGEDCDWDYKFGLIGSPHRDFVMREMENAINSPDQPITSTFLSTLALLQFTRQAPVAPAYPRGDDDQVSEYINGRRKAFDQLRLNNLRQLLMAIPQKQGQARATSLQTLLDHRSELSSSEFSQWSTLLASMPEVFSRLSPDDQSRMLQYQWRPVASAAMLPSLRRILKDSQNEPVNVPAHELLNVLQQEELRSIALRRIYELSPEEGRRLIMNEIRSPKPRVNERALRSLPDETLPEVDNVLAANLQDAHRKASLQTDVMSALVERYATGEIFARVRAVYESQPVEKWECRPQAALLAYFLRVEPSVGREYLNKVLATRARGYPRCYESVLKDVAKLHMSAELEEIATAVLDDEDSDVVSQAAGVLGEHGSADVEKALWQRLEKWHEAMQSASEPESVGSALREALARGRAWLSEPEKLKRLREFCFTERDCDELDRMINDWNPHINVDVSSLDGEWPSIHVAHYELKSIALLKEKLLQFPKGTLFRWNNRDDAEDLFHQIKDHLEAHGMKLERQPEQKPR